MDPLNPLNPLRRHLDMQLGEPDSHGYLTISVSIRGAGGYGVLYEGTLGVDSPREVINAIARYMPDTVLVGSQPHTNRIRVQAFPFPASAHKFPEIPHLEVYL